MEIRLGKTYITDEAVNVEFLDSLTQEQYNQFEHSLNEISDLLYVQRLSDFVRINDEELHQFLNSSLVKIAETSAISWNSFSRKDVDKIMMNTNRIFLNYLSSMRTLIEHSSVLLNRKYGKESEQFTEFKAMLAMFYEHSFAYRFSYKLRNYSQHVGLPITGFSINVTYNHIDRINNQLKVFFRRDELLESFDGWV